MDRPDADAASYAERTARTVAGVPAGLIGSPLRDGKVAQLVPAATVLVVRDGPGGIETLMLRRNSRLAFAGGMWVFPGGRIDPGDHDPDVADPTDPDALARAARRAAVREAREEAALELAADELVRFSHWIPPEQSGKRFETWFFVTAVADGALAEVVVDGGEITEHAWMSPAEALRRRDALDIELSPPTWISLWTLQHARDARDAVARARRREHDPERFATKIVVDGDDLLAVYDGDVAYQGGPADGAGPRHRLRMSARGWAYERDDLDGG